jgi:hypothetical protein
MCSSAAKEAAHASLTVEGRRRAFLGEREPCRFVTGAMHRARCGNEWNGTKRKVRDVDGTEAMWHSFLMKSVKKSVESRLNLSRDTIRVLQSSELTIAVGAGGSNGSGENSCNVPGCRLTDAISKGAKYYTCWTHQAEP